MGKEPKNNVAKISSIPMTTFVRANHQEIFLHLERLAGENAVAVATSVAQVAKTGDYATALQQLKAFDACLGGMGIYKSTGVKLPGIYRALSYVEFPFIPWRNAVDGTRGMIQASCAYLEGLMKKMVRLSPVELFRHDKMPLGALVTRLEKRLPPSLFVELNWLSQGIYNFPKHNFDLEPEGEPEHYFELDEAVAIYLIVRKLGRNLEELFGKRSTIFAEI